MSNVDSAGVERGECECGCKAFVKGSSGPKCVECKHAPVKHKELNPKSILQSGPTTTPDNVQLGPPAPHVNPSLTSTHHILTQDSQQQPPQQPLVQHPPMYAPGQGYMPFPTQQMAPGT